jgi:dipeptidyl aminopeptidase/acylaminoacyl peptidase
VTNLDKVKAASTNNDVFTLRLDEAGARAVKVSTSLGSDDGPAYSPDGRWLAFRSQKRAGYESDRFRLMLYDRGKKATKELMPNFDLWVDELAWAPDSSAIYFSSGDRGQEPVYEFDLAKNSLARLAIEPMSVHGEFSELSLSPSGKQLVATRMTSGDPGRIVSFHLDEMSPIIIDFFPPKHSSKPADPNLPNIFPIPAVFYGSELTHLNDGLLAQLDLAALDDFDFKGAEGTKVQGFIVKPPNFDSKKKYPVKFLIHGGPQGAWGDAWSYRWNPELMAASGYVVVMVNPRGSTGYGQAFIDGVNGDWGGTAYVDLMKGLDAAEAQFPFIDKARECALGGSYGGYMANWMLTHTNRFKCIVSHDGMYNPAAAYGDTEEMWFNEWEFRRPGDKEPGQPWRYSSLPATEDPFRKWSPMLHIQDAKTPTLVIHSQKDYRLDVSEGFQLFTALQRLGVPSEMLYFPDEGHWVLKPKNAELWNKTVSDWCDRWTKQ